MNLFPQIVFSGLLIGIIISAPMGPIGMLVIQRTLNKGRWAAFFTGLGASLSDLIYCLLTGLGMSFITDFVSTNQALLQLLGSIVLVGFAFYLFRKNPTRSLQSQTTQKKKKRTFFADFGTGFLFTFSNPLIMFFIIGLFARFNFLVPEYRYYHYVAGYAGILGGAILWWYTITFFVNKLRAHFNVRSMWILNRIIATILFIMAVFGCVMSIKSFIN